MVLTAIIGTGILVPYLKVRSLQLIWGLSTYQFQWLIECERSKDIIPSNGCWTRNPIGIQTDFSIYMPNIVGVSAFILYSKPTIIDNMQVLITETLFGQHLTKDIISSWILSNWQPHVEFILHSFSCPFLSKFHIASKYPNDSKSAYVQLIYLDVENGPRHYMNQWLPSLLIHGYILPGLNGLRSGPGFKSSFVEALGRCLPSHFPNQQWILVKWTSQIIFKYSFIQNTLALNTSTKWCP